MIGIFNKNYQKKQALITEKSVKNESKVDKMPIKCYIYYVRKFTKFFVKVCKNQEMKERERKKL